MEPVNPSMSADKSLTVFDEPRPLVPPYSREHSLLTASYTLPTLRAPYDTIPKYLRRELTVAALNRIHKYIWLTGRNSDVHPLHLQQIMQRNITINERTDFHLVWYENRIYIKPLPLCLLHYDFFEQHLCDHLVLAEETSTLHATACGLLRSYAQLIVHESDLRLAVMARLLPDVSWERWCAFAADVGSIGDEGVNKRYMYGELPLQRLNSISWWVNGSSLGFTHGYTRSSLVFQDRYPWLFMLFGFLSIGLSAFSLVTGVGPWYDRWGLQMTAFFTGVLTLGMLCLLVLLIVFMFTALVMRDLMVMGGDYKRMRSGGEVLMGGSDGSKV